jgi:hypothetical protein
MSKKVFLKNLNNESNHRILLWHALQKTTGLVVEYGSGHGSTPFLKNECKLTDREFQSFENNAEWSEKTGSTLITNWNLLPAKQCSVLLIDHAPGEQRKFDIVKNKDSAAIIVVHDTEKPADHGYQMRQHFGLFKYGVEINTPGGGAGAVMLSNSYDLSDLIGKKHEQFTITKIEQ